LEPEAETATEVRDGISIVENTFDPRYIVSKLYLSAGESCIAKQLSEETVN
jgi:hypothetical protein